MIVVGIDAHKYSHTAAIVERASGQVVQDVTVAAGEDGHRRLLDVARGRDGERVWAIEDCRHVSGRRERFLVARGERVVRVAPKLMAGAREGARTRGKSDPIDALAVARAAVREGVQALPTAWLDERALELRLLVDHRDDVVATRTRDQARLRWHLHDLDPTFTVPARALDRPIWWRRVRARLEQEPTGVRVRIALALLEQIRDQTASIRQLEAELARRVHAYAPRLLAERGCGPLTAAKLIGEIAGVERFATDAKLARNAGSAPIPFGQPHPPPARPRRQPPAQLRAAPARRQQGPLGPRQRRLPRPQAGRGQDAQGGAALPQAPPHPPRLETHAHAGPLPRPDHHHPLQHANARVGLDIGATW